MGYYWYAAMHRCFVCPEGATTASTGRDRCDLCEAGYYMHGDDCRGCPNHGDCDAEGSELATLAVDAGYWRASTAATDVYACPRGSARCPGGYGNGSEPYCERGATGALCDTCEAGRYSSAADDDACVECAGSTKATLYAAVYAAVVAVAAGVLVLAVVAGLRARRGAGSAFAAQLVDRWDAGARATSLLFENLVKSGGELEGAIEDTGDEGGSSLGTKFKLLMCFFQISSEFPANLGVAYPPSALKAMHALSASGLAFDKLVPFQCLQHAGFFTRLVVATLWPFAAGGLAAGGSRAAFGAGGSTLALLLSYCVFPSTYRRPRPATRVERERARDA